jgi:hypothetical protein
VFGGIERMLSVQVHRMSVIPGDVDTDRGPSTRVPLRHLLVALCFLLAGVIVGIGNALGVVPGRAHLAHLHLVLLGWVGVTILGAMTQFVPVWSGVRLHSRRLANAQLALVAPGVAVFALGWILTAFWVLATGATLLFSGFAVFTYNLGRTLQATGDWGVTERHFAYALVAFAVLATLGLSLALDYVTPVLASIGLAHVAVRDAHVTVAIFGAILTTVYGALYQLGTMFTQTELHAIDDHLRHVEEATHPLGVLLLATGRLAGWPVLERVGAVGVLVGALAVAMVISRKLLESRVAVGPLQRRYGVAMLALAAWAVTAAPAWLGPVGRTDGLFGAPAVGGVLVATAIGFVVAGTLYHVVPFLVWVDRYSDRLGFEPVPMIDDLYDSRIAKVDGACLVGGAAVAVLASVIAVPPVIVAVGVVLAAIGIALLAVNLFLVVHDHAPWSLGRVLLGALAPGTPRIDDVEGP